MIRMDWEHSSLAFEKRKTAVKGRQHNGAAGRRDQERSGRAPRLQGLECKERVGSGFW